MIKVNEFNDRVIIYFQGFGMPRLWDPLALCWGLDLLDWRTEAEAVPLEAALGFLHWLPACLKITLLPLVFW